MPAHGASVGVAFEDVDLGAFARQRDGTGQAGGAGADDGDAGVIRQSWLYRCATSKCRGSSAQQFLKG